MTRRRLATLPWLSVHRVAGILMLLLALAWTTGPQATQSTPVTAGDANLLSGAPLERAEVAARLAKIEADPALSAADRERLTDAYRQILDHLDALAEAKTTLGSLSELLAEAPAQTTAIRERQAAAVTPAEPAVKLPDGADLVTVQGLLAQERAAVATGRERLQVLEQGLRDEAEALPRWRRELANLNQRALDLDDELAGVRSTSGSGLEMQTRRWLLESERERLRAEVQVLDLKLAGADVRRALTQAQRDEAQAVLNRALARQEWLQAEEDRLRRAEAAQVVADLEAAKEASADAHPRVRELARANTELAEAIHALSQETAKVQDVTTRTIATTSTLAQDFAHDRQRIAAAGLNRALGRVLVDRRERLPEEGDLRRQTNARVEAEAESTLVLLGWREELLALEAGAEQRYAADLAVLPPTEADALRAQLDEQAGRREELLGRAIEAGERHLRALAELDLAADELSKLSHDYRAFLAQHLLWMRSHVPVTQQSFAALPAVFGELLSPANWLQVAQTLGAGMAGGWAGWVGMGTILVLLALDRVLRQRLRATTLASPRPSSHHFGYTLWAIILTLLLAMPAPLFLALLGLVLTSQTDTASFAHGVGEALQRLAPGLYYLLALRMMCLSGGVIERHFRWRNHNRRALARYLNVAIWTLVPLGFITLVANTLGEVEAATLGRLALTGLTLSFTLLVASALHPRRGLVRDGLAAAPEGLASRTRHIWYPLVVALSLALTVLTLAGFQYTAVTLFYRWLGQFCLLLGLVLVQQLIMRWLLLTRQQLALRQAQGSRSRPPGQGPAGPLGVGGESPDPVVARSAKDMDDEALDLAALDGQTRQLVNALLTVAGAVGFWVLWSDVLPALNRLEHITLWHTSSTEDGVVTTLPVTLADLAVLVVIIVVAVISVRHLPGLLEILLFQKTRISAGGRYTLIALTGYGITAVAVVLVAGRLGLTWQQVQWLVAALGVGIGFGLREIVANFISGLILLFERPVRVGDTVTIGAHSGVVSRIEIRATTIRTWDQRELLVPNNQLITGEVINWTLSDQINRGEILISIESGSNTETALRILHEVVAADSRVMTDPAPVITVQEFGERGMGLLLWFFLPTLASRLQIRGELMSTIDTRLRAAGIAIGLPQREIRLRSEGGVHPASR